jgi:hypothetical protein
MSQQAEREAKEEFEKLKLEIQTERAHVRAARDIEKHKQEQSLETKWQEFRGVTADVNTELDNLLQSFRELPNVTVITGGKSLGTNA